jgi:two-component system, sensor histidine kinase PdtaS
MSTLDLERDLRAQRTSLRELVEEWSNADSRPPQTDDSKALLDALTGTDETNVLPYFEAAGQHLAEQSAPLEPRMDSAHRSAEALAKSIAHVFADNAVARAAGQERLADLMRDVDLALVRGYQSVATRRLAEATAWAQQGLARVQALRRINAAANSTLDLSETLQTTVRAVAEVLRADLCCIFLFDETTRDLQLRATNGPRPRGGTHFALRMGEGYTGWVAEHGHPLSVRDASADSQFAYESGAYTTPYRGLLSMPIIFFTVEKLVGVLSVQTVEPRDFTPEEISFLEVVAGQLAMNIENGRLYEQTDETLRRKVHELSTLHRVSALVASTLELKDVLQTIVTQAVQLSGADKSIIFDLDRATQRLRPLASHGFEPEGLPRWGLMVGQCCAGRVVQTEEPSLCLDCMFTDQGCFFHDAQESVGDLHSVLCVPLMSTHGAQGALCVFSSQRYLLSPQQLQLVVTFANVAAIAMENARLFEQTREGLKAKGVLLREMHHRVKNNLQQVASILSMQRRRAKSPQVERILAESVGRIQGIAATHDLLSREQLGLASVDEIARKIVGIVQGNLVPPTLRLAMQVEPCPAHMPSEQATTLAIVLNELIANAIEHGFEGRSRGRIVISGERADGTIIVRVADDGVGLRPDFDLEHSEGLGLQLVSSLVRSDLHGSFALRQAAGATGQPLADDASAGDEPWTIAELAFPAVLAADGIVEEAG